MYCTKIPFTTGPLVSPGRNLCTVRKFFPQLVNWLVPEKICVRYTNYFHDWSIGWSPKEFAYCMQNPSKTGQLVGPGRNLHTGVCKFLPQLVNWSVLEEICIQYANSFYHWLIGQSWKDFVYGTQIPFTIGQLVGLKRNLCTVCRFLPRLVDWLVPEGICVQYTNYFHNQSIGWSWKEFAYCMQNPSKTGQLVGPGRNLYKVCKLLP